MDNLNKKINNLPELPGVYFFKDKFDNIIYIGKSKVLKKRVKQYFYKSKNHSPKIEKLIFNIYDLEYRVTDTELEALVLESRMIKKYKPKYNSLLKNFKGYPYIKITNQEYPIVQMVYKISDDGGMYFGPYSKKRLVYSVIKDIEDLFSIRKCGIRIKREPCLYYHMGKCVAPCMGYDYIKKEYDSIIDEITKILQGKDTKILEELKHKMKNEAKIFNFEKAEKYKNKIKTFKTLIYKQKIISKALSEEEIIIIEKTIHKHRKVYYIRGGRILDKLLINKENRNIDKNMIRSFINPLYTKEKKNISILPQEEIDEAQIIQSWVIRNNVDYIEITDKSTIDMLVDKLYDKLIILIEGDRDSV
ncbi:GIY-YIG nuclease family protein [Clostridium sp. D2Q-11]|uniref:GIY-YIG nuclease family protein n=1 Tax=Anaeromonas frigoriresistens TaxID=2683708 RepID=A0A942UUL1_9FIRM|nr:GIY-YIG nuclease family protein [Anaeromonas frigoriresistens]MBS4537760.1 GIY-YIG nuclease family protein [Anaeromonas frigoriresistens]